MYVLHIHMRTHQVLNLILGSDCFRPCYEFYFRQKVASHEHSLTLHIVIIYFYGYKCANKHTQANRAWRGKIKSMHYTYTFPILPKFFSICTYTVGPPQEFEMYCFFIIVRFIPAPAVLKISSILCLKWMQLLHALSFNSRLCIHF